MTAKVVHFGDRLRKLIEEKYITQAEFAKRVNRSDNRVSAWCGMQNFANRASTRRVLFNLIKDGVNPEYLWNPLVEDWKMKPVTDAEEVEMLEMRITIAEQRQELDRLKRELRDLEKRLEG